MYINVNGSRIHGQIQEVAGMVLFFYKAVAGRRNGMMEVRTFYKSVIDKKKLLPSTLFRKFGLTDIPTDRYHLRIFLYGYQLFIGFCPKNINDTLPMVGTWQIKDFASIIIKM